MSSAEDPGARGASDGGGLAAPAPLVLWDPKRERFTFTDDEAVLTSLKGLPSPVCSVAVAGALRSGKSFLMNSLFWYPDTAVGKGPGGFALGSTVRSVTKGIWVWAKRLPAGEGSLVLLDTEGLFDPQHTDPSYDLRVLAMTIALSSTLAFNVKSTLDSGFIETLAVATTHFEHAFVKAREGNVVATFPRLHVVVRDFFLGTGGVSDDDWLTSAIEAGTTAAPSSGDAPRDAVPPAVGRAADRAVVDRCYPRERRGLSRVCRPADSVINRLETSAVDDVPPAFRAGIASVVRTLLASDQLDALPPAARIHAVGSPASVVSGVGFVHSAQHAVKVVNDQHIPAETALGAAAALLRDRAFANAVAAVDGHLEAVVMPLMPCGAAALFRAVSTAESAGKEVLAAELGAEVDTGVVNQQALRRALSEYVAKMRADAEATNAEATTAAAAALTAPLRKQLDDAVELDDAEALIGVADSVMRDAACIDCCGDEAAHASAIAAFKRGAVQQVATALDAMAVVAKAAAAADIASVRAADATAAQAAAARQLAEQLEHEHGIERQRRAELDAQESLQTRTTQLEARVSAGRREYQKGLAARSRDAEQREAQMRRRLADLSVLQDSRRATVRNETLAILQHDADAAARLAALERAAVIAVSSALGNRPYRVVRS